MGSLNPSAVTAKWKQRAGAAAKDWTTGIQSVTVAPGQLAAARANEALAGYTQAIQSGRWASRVGAVPLGEWQQKSVSKQGNYTSGINAGEQKRARFDAAWMPLMAAAKERLRSVPRDGGASSLSKVQAIMDIGAQFKNQGR
jgi:hypothetical protein